ncbi:MAG TPA: S8 family serine peptidase [Steroidobacteraceae bacterium]
MRPTIACLSLAALGLGSLGAHAENYIVLYGGSAVPGTAVKTIQKAGGALVHAYPQIGVVLARSDNAAFAGTLRTLDRTIEGVSATSRFASRVDGALESTADAVTESTPVAWGTEPLSGLQWDMVQIGVPAAHAVSGGSPSIVVGNLDSGIDFTHPDLAPNVDFANSVSCISGAPDPNPAAWDDDNGHGTHTAGTIAAAANGIGIVGVAPNVRLAAVKVGNADGYIFPEAAICGFVWAGDRRLNVTNNSYFVDPWLFNCRNDPEQRAIWKAIRRAISYAISKGVVVVASLGNTNHDLSKTNIDTISPDFPPGSAQEREVTNACSVIPVEVPGVIGVSANGNLLQKAYYSSYGVGVTQLVAPGGDRRFQLTAAAPNGRVLSTYPAKFFSGGPLFVQDSGAVYAYLQGTSMAAPHVAGVAALVLSERQLPAGAVTGVLNSTATPLPCPENPFDPGPPFGAFVATCAGGDGYNGFYGHGQVDAHRAVTAVH